MLTDQRSGYALKTAKAKVKNVEFGRSKENWPHFTVNSNNLSYDTIFILSKICEIFIETETLNEQHLNDLIIVAQYFDASTKTNDRSNYNWDFILSSATAYFMSNDFGSAKAILRNIKSETIVDNIAKQLFCFLSFILNGDYFFKKLEVENEFLKTICYHFSTGTEFINKEALIQVRSEIKKTDLIYSNYYIELLIATILIAKQNSAWILLPKFSDLSVEKWKNYLVRKDTPKILWSAQKLIGEKRAKYKNSQDEM